MKLNTNFVHMLSIIKRVKFLLASTNQHGVHSPFVYALVTQCLYKKNKTNFNFKATKHHKVLDNLIQYFKPKNALVIDNANSVELFFYRNVTTTILKSTQNLKLKASTSYDFVVLNALKYSDEAINTIISILKNDSVLIISNLNSFSNSSILLKQIINNPKVTVTINCFYIGLVFIRREQHKQHFTIRL